MQIHQLRERRIERTWRLVRRTSAISTGVVLTILLVLDASFRFESWRFNLTISLFAVFFVALSRIDSLIHRMVLRKRERRLRLDDNPE